MAPRQPATSALLALWLSAPAAAPRQTPTFPTAGARVEITVDSGGTARVAESYALAPGTAVPSLEYLTRPCAGVGPVSLVLAGSRLTPRRVRHGPWVELAFDSTPRAAGGGAFLTVSYQVRLQARWASIPVVLPQAPLGTSRPARLDLALPAGARARPVLPHFAPGAPGRWSAELRALPSVVRVDLGTAATGASCGEPTPRGDAGSFDLRFAIFVATLALWIPLYFWWARRQDRGP